MSRQDLFTAVSKSFSSSSSLYFTQKDENTLVVRHDPGYVLLGVLLAVALAGLILSPFLSNSLVIALASVFGIGWSLYGLYTQRQLVCEMNKTAGLIYFHKGGILGSSLDESNTTYQLEDVTSVQMQRHVQRNGDLFQIHLMLKSGDLISLSAADLGFVECQEKAAKIHAWLGLGGVIQAMG